MKKYILLLLAAIVVLSSFSEAKENKEEASFQSYCSGWSSSGGGVWTRDCIYGFGGQERHTAIYLGGVFTIIKVEQL